jgi:hypothetical protein
MRFGNATHQRHSAGNAANPVSRPSQDGVVRDAPFRPHLEHRAQRRNTSLEASPPRLYAFAPDSILHCDEHASHSGCSRCSQSYSS